MREQARFARSAIKAPRAQTELLSPRGARWTAHPRSSSPHDCSDDDEVEAVDRVHLLEGSLGERGPGTAAPTAWEAIRGLEEALNGLDRRQAGTGSEVQLD